MNLISPDIALMYDHRHVNHNVRLHACVFSVGLNTDVTFVPVPFETHTANNAPINEPSFKVSWIFPFCHI